MCGVRYANNLLKNPATKRLSGKTVGRIEERNIPEKFPNNRIFAGSYRGVNVYNFFGELEPCLDVPGSW